VDAVFAGDSPAARLRLGDDQTERARCGFHKALREVRDKSDTSAELYRRMRRWLDAFHEGAANRTSQARRVHQ
jgi:hypothetical protein